MACIEVTSKNANSLLENYKTFLFDCDGVLWDSSKSKYGAHPGAVDAIKHLKELGKTVVLLTNNSTKSRKEYLKKCIDLDFDIKKTEVYGTSYAAAVYVKDILKCDKKVYVVGVSGITEEFDEIGIQYIQSGHIKIEDDQEAFKLGSFSKDPEVGAIVVGYDTFFNMKKLTEATQYAVDENIAFIATNTDSSISAGNGILIPGTGCVVAAVETAANRKAMIVGKPNKLMFECIQKMHGIDPKTTLMVGDRMETDILFGKNCGLSTMLVLSGVTDEKLLEKTKDSGNELLIPDYVASGVSVLCKPEPAVEE